MNFVFVALYAFFFIGLSPSLEANKFVKISNDSDQPIDFAYTIPEYTAANLELIKMHPQRILYSAIRDDSPEGVRLAIQAGAALNLIEDNKTPIVYALEMNQVNAFEEILKHSDLDMYVKDAHYAHVKMNLINILKSCKNTQLLALLVQFSQNITKAVFGSDPALFVLRNFGHSNESLNLLQILINLKHISIQNLSYDAWSCVLKDHSGRTAQFLVDNGALSQQRIQITIGICRSGYTQSYKTIWTPVFLAVDYNNFEALKILSGRGNHVAWPGPCHYDTSIRCSGCGTKHICKLERTSLLEFAQKRNRVEIIEWLKRNRN